MIYPDVIVTGRITDARIRINHTRTIDITVTPDNINAPDVHCTIRAGYGDIMDTIDNLRDVRRIMTQYYRYILFPQWHFDPACAKHHHVIVTGERGKWDNKRGLQICNVHRLQYETDNEIDNPPTPIGSPDEIPF